MQGQKRAANLSGGESLNFPFRLPRGTPCIYRFLSRQLPASSGYEPDSGKQPTAYQSFSNKLDRSSVL